MPDFSARDDVAPSVGAPPRRPRTALRRTGRLALWAALSFAVNLVEQVAEVVAPLVLAAGLAWWAALRVAGAVSVEPSVQAVLETLPARFDAAGWLLTPGGLIRDGVLLMALVAACRTLNAILAREA